MFSHILANDERNAFLFTYDLTSASSFKLYLKKAIKELIFAHEEVQDYKSTSSKSSHDQQLDNETMQRGNQMVPYLLVGMKKDKKDKIRVMREEQNQLVNVLKKYMKCDQTRVDSESPDDVVQALHRLMSLASSYLFPHY